MVKRFYQFLIVLVLIPVTHSLGAQEISCNNHINVGVNFACSIDLTIDMFLEGDINLSEDIQDPAYTFIVFDLSSTPIIWGDYTGPTRIDGIVLDANLLFNIYHNNTPLCWGTVLFEDKIAPELDCDCPVGGEDLNNDGIKEYAEECTRSCYELPVFKEKYWDRLRDEILPGDFEDFIDDNTDDNCNGLGEDNISYYDVFQDLGCDGTLMRRTWTLTYPSGLNGQTSTKSCVREYFFKPIGLETVDTARLDPNTGRPVPAEDSLILPFHIVKLNCGFDIQPMSIAAYFDDPATRDQDTDDDRIDPDELDVDKIIENNEGIAYAYPHYYINGRNPSGPHAQPINNEICNIIVGYSDTEVESCAPGCYGNHKILRNWTILDWCSGEYITYGQVIKVLDTDAPTIDLEDISVSVDPWKCAADALLPHPEHLNDFCDNYITYRIGSVSGGLSVTGNADLGYVLHDAQYGNVYTVEYISEDCCGNIGRHYVNVNIVDNTPPVPVTKEFITTSLSNIGNPIDGNQGIAKIYATDVDNGSYDGCTGVSVAVRRVGKVCPDADTLWGDFVKFCCEDLEGFVQREIDVHFRVTDENGNHNYAWSKVLLEDKSGSTLECPKDLVLTCDMDYNDFVMTGLPHVFSACGELSLNCDLDELIEDTEPRRKGPNDGFFMDPKYNGIEVPPYDPSCGYGAIRRQFGSCSSCVQWFVIEPINPFNPASIDFPDDIIIDCDAVEVGEPEFDPSTCSLIGVSLESDTFFFQNGICNKILNRWTIINWCAYDPTNPTSPGKWEYTQQVKLIDNQDPVLTVADSICIPANAECVSRDAQLSARAVDEGKCSSDWLKWELTIDLNADWTPDYTYGTNQPKFVNGTLNPFYIPPSTNDELVTVDLPDGIAGDNIWHQAVWRVSDGCNNTVSTVRYFQITDKKAPTPSCLNLSTAVMSGNGQVELWAIDFNVKSLDNCTPEEYIYYTFSEIPPPVRNDSEYDSSSDLQWYNGSFWYYDPETGDYMDQDDYFDRDADRWEPGIRSAGRIFTMDDADNNGHANISIYAWDQNGNSDHCVVNLRLVDNMGVGEGRISGQVMTETGQTVENVMTELMSDAPGYPNYNMTNNLGLYAFDDTPFFNDYSLSALKDDDHTRGVSTLDLLMIQKHILGQAQLDSPYKMIAADVNNDKKITAADLIELRKLILGIYNDFPSNTSWRFIDSKQILNENNPWSFVEEISINDLRDNMLDADFVAVKIGDVNQSALLLPEAPENYKALTIEPRDNALGFNDIVELDLMAYQETVYGFQFTMDIDGFEFLGLKGPSVDNNNVAVHGDKLTISCYNLDGLGQDELIATLSLKVKPGNSSKQWNTNSSIIREEAYFGKDLRTGHIVKSGDSVVQEPELFQNSPNPFSEETVIGFSLPAKMEYTLNFHDINGKSIQSFRGTGEKGYNQLRLNSEDLKNNSLIYYTLETKLSSITKHMIVIE